MSVELVPTTVATKAELDAMEPESRALAVVDMLDRARHWLADAVERTDDPSEIKTAKAEIATAATYAKQLGLSRDIQENAREMVRRAEYALAGAIRNGQAEGTIRKRGENVKDTDPISILGPYDFATDGELTGNGAGIMLLADATPEEFDEAITEAKAEGNLSRANVVRKVQSKAGSTRTPSDRVKIIASLAIQGYASRQMLDQVGVTEERIRKLARQHNIEIPGDKALGKTRRDFDSDRIVSEIVEGLGGTQMAIGFIDYTKLDKEKAALWAASLKKSITVLTTLHKRLQETTQND